MHKAIEEVANREMSRKEFLALVGLGLASIMGLANILRVLSGKKPAASQGYGSATYGGKR